MQDDAVPWLTPAEQRAWVSLCTMFMTVPTAVDAQLKHDSAVNLFEYTLLAGLSDAPDSAMRMSALADFAAVSMSRLSHAVTRLERQGWVRRRAVPSEARAVEAVLTPAGRAFLTEAAPAHVRRVRTLVFDVLTPEQVRQLEQLSRALVASASPQAERMLNEVLDLTPGT